MGLRSSLIVSSFFLCVTFSNVVSQCTNNSDCPENFICDNGKCINPAPPESVVILDNKTEVVGGSTVQIDIIKAKSETYKGFSTGTQFIVPGFLGYGNSLIGVEYEIGLNRVVGLQAGAGFIGAEFGAVIHLLARSNYDLHFIADANVAFGAGVLPGISIGMRGLFGKAARVGLGGKIGLAFSTFDKTFYINGERYEYNTGDPLLIIGIGVPIRIR